LIIFFHFTLQLLFMSCFRELNASIAKKQATEHNLSKIVKSALSEQKNLEKELEVIQLYFMSSGLHKTTLMFKNLN